MSSMQLHVLSQVSRENFSPFRITTFSRQLVPERASCSLSTDTQRRRKRKKKKPDMTVYLKRWSRIDEVLQKQVLPLQPRRSWLMPLGYFDLRRLLWLEDEEDSLDPDAVHSKDEYSRGGAMSRRVLTLLHTPVELSQNIIQQDVVEGLKVLGEHIRDGVKCMVAGGGHPLRFLRDNTTSVRPPTRP